jgi:hypothetical protein
MIGTGFCVITAATTTEIKCTSIDATTAAASTGLITPTNTGTASEPVLELAMLGRIIEQATCDVGGGCTFSYLTAITPLITDISHKAAVNAGDVVTVSGTNGIGDLKTAFAKLTASIGG